MPITQYLHHQRFSPAAIRLRAMTNETETLTSGIDPASFSSVIKPTNDLFRYVNGPWIDTYRLPDDRSRYGSFDKLAEDAENQVRDILDADDCPAVKSEALYRSFLNTDAIEPLLEGHLSGTGRSRRLEMDQPGRHRDHGQRAPRLAGCHQGLHLQ